MNSTPPPYSQTPPFGGTGFSTQIPPPPPGYHQHGNNLPPGIPPPLPPYIAGQPTVLQNYVGTGTFQIRSKHPTSTKCQYCNQEVISHPEARPGGMTWLICLFIALIGFPCGCCLIPFCIDDCKNFHHKCPNCQKVMYVYSPL